MTESNHSDIIKPTSAPLSHLGAGRGGSQFKLDRRVVLLCAGFATVLIAAVVLFSVLAPSAPPTAGTVSNSAPGATSDQATPSQARNQEPDLAPFAQTQRERARDQAQAALAQFVERQIQLEDEMQVDTWGGEALREAISLAEQGDADFVAERFDAALQGYQAAADQLAQVIESGHQRYDELADEAESHIDEQNPQLAEQAISQALKIKVADTRFTALQDRLSVLPEVIVKLRDARNFELAGEPASALALYDEVEQLDPAFKGLDILRAGNATAARQSDLSAALSDGFRHLDASRFESARSAFNKALRLDPGNDIALGGLAQVAKDNDLAVMKRLQQTAQSAAQREEWQTTIDSYEQVLKLDKNIQFAKSGLSEARAQLRDQNLLDKIAAAPERLSSEKLYLEAVAILERARTLPRQGPRLTASAEKVAGLLVTYRDPVEVQLVSDNATDVIISNVGRVGTFATKTLQLRPGQYTIRGSQNGCKDIYMKINVLPGIEPLDLSCPERL